MFVEMNRLKQLFHSERFVVSMIIVVGLLINVARMASNDFHIGVYDDSGSYFTSGDVIASGHFDRANTRLPDFVPFFGINYRRAHL